MEKNKILRFGIIGAGPSGLTLAFALSKRENVHVTVFEKAPDHRNIPTFNPLRSYTIDITGHGARAVQYLNMKERFNKDLILFKGIRLPIINPKLEETYHGDGCHLQLKVLQSGMRQLLMEKFYFLIHLVT